jgi:hypothetical protein
MGNDISFDHVAFLSSDLEWELSIVACKLLKHPF